MEEQNEQISAYSQGVGIAPPQPLLPCCGRHALRHARRLDSATSPFQQAVSACDRQRITIADFLTEVVVKKRRLRLCEARACEVLRQMAEKSHRTSRKLKRGLSGILRTLGKKSPGPERELVLLSPTGASHEDDANSSAGGAASDSGRGRGDSSAGSRTSMGRIAKLEAQLAALTAQRQRLVASRLHEDWRRSRPLVMTGEGEAQFEPNVKHIDGEQYDIANLPFDELPEQFKTSNLSVAKLTCNLIEEALSARKNIDINFVNTAASRLHEEWVKDKRTSLERMEQTVPRDMLPFQFLPPEQQEKVRTFVRPSVDVYKTFILQSGLTVSPECLTSGVEADAVEPEVVGAGSKPRRRMQRRHSMTIANSPRHAPLLVDIEGAEIDAMERTWRGQETPGSARGEKVSPRHQGVVSEAWVKRKRNLRLKRAVAKCKATRRRLDEANRHSAELLAAIQARDITIAVLHRTLAAAGLEAPHFDALDPLEKSMAKESAALASAATAEKARRASLSIVSGGDAVNALKEAAAEVASEEGSARGAPPPRPPKPPRRRSRTDSAISLPSPSGVGSGSPRGRRSPEPVPSPEIETPPAVAAAPAPASAPTRVSSIQVGDECEARWKGRERWFSAEIVAVRPTGRFDVRYGDGDEENDVPPVYVRRKRSSSGRTLPVTAEQIAAISTSGSPRPAPTVETEELSQESGSIATPEPSPQIASLKNAKSLYDDGLITQDAFKRIKGSLLTQMTGFGG